MTYQVNCNLFSPRRLRSSEISPFPFCLPAGPTQRFSWLQGPLGCLRLLVGSVSSQSTPLLCCPRALRPQETGRWRRPHSAYHPVDPDCGDAFAVDTLVLSAPPPFCWGCRSPRRDLPALELTVYLGRQALNTRCSREQDGTGGKQDSSGPQWRGVHGRGRPARETGSSWAISPGGRRVHVRFIWALSKNARTCPPAPIN